VPGHLLLRNARCCNNSNLNVSTKVNSILVNDISYISVSNFCTEGKRTFLDIKWFLKVAGGLASLVRDPLNNKFLNARICESLIALCTQLLRTAQPIVS